MDRELDASLAAIAEMLDDIRKKLDVVQGDVLVQSKSIDFEQERKQHPISAFNFVANRDEARMLAKRPPLPDPRLVRRIIQQRQLRSRFFGKTLFSDPAWDMLLDLTAARAEHKRVSVTSLCIASGVPSTTALRWIGILINAGLCERLEDDQDRRRVFIGLTDKGAQAAASYFNELGKSAIDGI